MTDREQLMNKQTNILLQMEALRQEGNIKEKMGSIRELKREYNDIMDILGDFNTTARDDPIDKFPPELFGDIVYEAVRLSLPNQSYKQFNDILILTLVSRRWRDFVLRMPLLWTNIDINSRDEDFLAKTSLGLELSHNLPISVNLCFPIEKWDAVLPLLQLSRQRINRIAIYPQPINDSESALAKLEQLLPMPNLMHLESLPLENSDRVLRLFFAHNCPLKTIKGLAVPEDTWLLPSVRQLQDADIAADLDKFITARHNMPLLRHIRIYDTISQPSTPNSIPLNKTWTEFQPLRWQSLVCSYQSPHSISTLTTRLPNLTTLRIGVNPSSLHGLLVRLHQLLQLRRLTISFDGFQISLVKDELFRTDILPNPNVTTLEVIPMGQIAMDENEEPSHGLVTIPDALTRAMPDLEELMLDLGITLDVPEFYDWSKLARLSKLRLTSSRQSSLGHQCILPSTLESVQLNTLPSLWTQFSCSSATKLVVFTTNRYLLLGKTVPLEAEKWPALRTLAAFWPCINGQGQNYAHLNELTLRASPHPSSGNWFDDDHATQFCHNLATNPAWLPSLENLRLCELPQWDIFLIMLKRRNINTLKGIQPLKSLSIGGFYPEELTDPIVNLLRGRFSDWPTLYEISIHVALELIGDTSMYVNPIELRWQWCVNAVYRSGCDMCLQCFRSCTMKLFNMNKIQVLNDPPNILPYPPSEEDILLTWEARTRALKRTVYGSRLSSCAKWHTSGFVTLTKDS
jgi:hypothetical protein